MVSIKTIFVEENSMKLTDQIKEKIDNAKSEKEVKTILESVKGEAEDAGLILEAEDLDKVAGGFHYPVILEYSGDN